MGIVTYRYILLLSWSFCESRGKNHEYTVYNISAQQEYFKNRTGFLSCLLAGEDKELKNRVLYEKITQWW